MADARITELAPLIASNAQPTVDVLAVADVSTTETKKITLADVVESGIGSVADGSIPGKKLIPGSVTSLEIADGGIEAVDLADNAVTTPKINDGAVTPDKIASHVFGICKAFTLIKTDKGLKDKFPGCNFNKQGAFSDI